MASKLQCLLPHVVFKMQMEVVNNAADVLRFRGLINIPLILSGILQQNVDMYCKIAL